jgi:uncharacterized protein with von Willebrand factor type A (vWA) domain
MPSDYLNEFFRDRRISNPPDVETKFTIEHNKWDQRDYEQMLKEVKDFKVADRKLQRFVPATGAAAMADTYYSAAKADPRLKSLKAVRPSFAVNHAVMTEAQKLRQLDELRCFSVGDPIAAGMACATMEPEIEALFDKIKEEQKKANEIEQQMQQYEDLAEQDVGLDDMIKAAENKGDEKGAANYQDQQGRIQEQMEQLEKEIRQGASELNSDLEGQKDEIRRGMMAALNAALDDAQDVDQFSQLWGSEKGGLKRLPADQRIRIAERLRTEKFKKLAQLIGPMLRLAFAEQKRKIPRTYEEVYDVELGNDLAKLLPVELINLTDEGLFLDFLLRLSEGSLQQYMLRGDDKIAKGGIYFLEDGSGSMSGAPEIWSKALGLALLMIAKMQNRPFYAVHFGSPGEHRDYEFHIPGDGSVDTFYNNKTEHFDPIEGILDFAEIFFGSGTCFVTPLSIALQKMEEDFQKRGAVKADIVFVTDGICGVPNDWLENFCERRDELGFKVWSICIGGDYNSEPLTTISGDIKPRTIGDFVSPQEVGDIFGGL